MDRREKGVLGTLKTPKNSRELTPGMQARTLSKAGASKSREATKEERKEEKKRTRDAEIAQKMEKRYMKQGGDEISDFEEEEVSEKKSTSELEEEENKIEDEKNSTIISFDEENLKRA